MNIPEITKTILKYKEQNKRIFATSSFQTHSIVLLHIISKVDNSIPIYFINTGYHFPETIHYKNIITKLFGLNVQDLMPIVSKSQQKDNRGNLLFASDPDYCCFLNKIQPVENLMSDFDVWINGIRKDQTNSRNSLHTFEIAQHNVVRYHPILDWTVEMINQYLEQNNLPHHPLEKLGYSSIGCEPCTALIDNCNRDNRWFGLNKTECGLNNDLIIK